MSDIQKKNMLLLLIASATYSFFSVISDGNLTSYILSSYTDSKFIIGAYSCLMALGIILLQFPVSNRLETQHWHTYKTFYRSLWANFFATLGLAVSAFLFWGQSIFLALFFLFNFLLQLSRGITNPSLTYMVKQNFDKHFVPKYFKTKMIVVAASRLLALTISFFVISQYFTLENNYKFYFLMFAIAPLGYLISTYFFKSSQANIIKTKQEKTNYFNLIKQILKEDTRYKKYLYSSVFAFLAYTFTPFIIVMAKEQLGITLTDVFTMTASVIGATILFASVAGKLKLAKFYERYLSIFRTLAIIFLLILICFPISKPFIYLVLILNAFTQNGEELTFSNFSIIYGKERASSYASMYNWIVNLIKMVGYLGIGILIDAFGYSVSIMFSILLLIISISLLLQKNESY
ncbi:MAG: hypothetical protein AB7S44_03515 [Spirochaetales bacterium]